MFDDTGIRLSNQLSESTAAPFLIWKISFKIIYPSNQWVMNSFFPVYVCACICIHTDCQPKHPLSERTLKCTEGKRVFSSLFVISSLLLCSVLLPRLLPPPYLYDIILISPALFIHVFNFDISSSPHLCFYAVLHLHLISSLVKFGLKSRDYFPSLLLLWIHFCHQSVVSYIWDLQWPISRITSSSGFPRIVCDVNRAVTNVRLQSEDLLCASF